MYHTANVDGQTNLKIRKSLGKILDYFMRCEISIGVSSTMLASNLGFQEKDLKMFQISIAPFSMTSGVIRRRNILVIRISFCSWKHLYIVEVLIHKKSQPHDDFFWGDQVKELTFFPLFREHGVVGDMRDAWHNARLRKNVSLAHTFHGFNGNKQGAVEFFKLIFRALCLCWDRQTQDLHVDWILFTGRSLVPVSCEVVNDNMDGQYPYSHYPIFVEFMLPRTVRLLDPPPIQDDATSPLS
uniref:Endonuclease/exonuclease/phosphatase domain-containing protein n=1 Tax=Lactuca sativa TaxID=4236 RepID=A0A9R1UZV1_LACSA|nr:hypothetical protein LSAT_V11C700368600 [Lactuca sativa]